MCNALVFVVGKRFVCLFFIRKTFNMYKSIHPLTSLDALIQWDTRNDTLPPETPESPHQTDTETHPESTESNSNYCYCTLTHVSEHVYRPAAQQDA